MRVFIDEKHKPWMFYTVVAALLVAWSVNRTAGCYEQTIVDKKQKAWVECMANYASPSLCNYWEPKP